MKNNTFRKISIILIFIFLLFSVSASAFVFSESKLSKSEVEKILDGIDDKFNYEGDLKALISFVSTDEGEKEPPKRGILYRNDEDDEFLFIFKEPPSDNGNGYLYKESVLYFYDSATGKISQKTDSESISGDSRRRDLENDSKKTSDLYDFEHVEDDKLGSNECYVFRGVAKEKDIEDPIIRMWITKKGHIPLMRKEYSVEERIARTARYKSFRKMTDKKNNRNFIIIDKTLITNEQKPDTRTIIEFEKISLGDIDKKIFTENYLRNQS